MNKVRDISKHLGYCPKVMNFRDYFEAFTATGNPCIIQDWYDEIATSVPNVHPTMMKRIDQLVMRRNRTLGFKEDYIS